MSAEACVAYFGLRFEVASDEVEALESRSDSRQLAARKSGLSTYWANFGAPDERYVLFVGKKIGVLGPENVQLSTISAEELCKMTDETVNRLRDAGLDGEPALHLEWLHDA